MWIGLDRARPPRPGRPAPSGRPPVLVPLSGPARVELSVSFSCRLLAKVLRFASCLAKVPSDATRRVPSRSILPAI